MAGTLKNEEGTITTITSTGSGLANNSATLAGALDLRLGGSGNSIGDYDGIFDMTVQWSTITGIDKDTVVAEIYAVPSLDGGSTYPDVDTTAGASKFAQNYLVAYIVASRTATSNTNMLMASTPAVFQALKYNIYVKNTSGQTMTANWTLRVLTEHGKYS